METSGVAVSEEMKSGAARLAEDGKTPLFIAAGTSLLGVIAVADVVKADSAAAIAAPPLPITAICNPPPSSPALSPLPSHSRILTSKPPPTGGTSASASVAR